MITLNTALILLVFISEVSQGLAGPPRHKHEVRDVPSALTSTQTEEETTYYTEPTVTYTSLPPLWPPRPTPHSSKKSTTSSATSSSPEYPYNTPTDTMTTSWDFPTPSINWNITIYNSTRTSYFLLNTTLSTELTVIHFNLTTTTTSSDTYFTWSQYSDTWGDHNTYPTPSSADTVTTTSIIKTLTIPTITTTLTTVVSKTAHSYKPSTKLPPRPTSSYNASSFTFKTTPFANLTTFTSPRWTTVPIASLTGSPFCSNAADPDVGIGNHCVCKNGQTVGVIPFSKGGNQSDYQPCAYTTVGY
ncbi:hypothetical protein B0T20DRAFT_365949 [Sordaria brevicollis]|uniref:Uncharacterized protein n=1 Tax=Sordaria brevicollis TaxID=83679 RepID=A0AAE0U0H4_SORBR|nr:hypothetical protein B0T20DRAFT_365949 [Sordaria brevicollis]